MVTSDSSGWDPRRPFEAITSFWTDASKTLSGALPGALPAVFPAALPTSGVPGVATFLQAVFDIVSRRFTGRRFTIRSTASEITLRLVDLDAALDPLSLSVGQLDDVRIVAEQVSIRPREKGPGPSAAAEDGAGNANHGLQFERVEVLARDVHIRPAEGPTLASAPVELEVTVATARLTELVAKALPWLEADVAGESGGAVPRLRWRGRPGIGHLEVDVRPDGSRLWWRARTIVLGSRRITLPNRLPLVPTRLPRLPDGLRLVDVQPGREVVTLQFVLASWRESLTPKRLEDLMTQLRTATAMLDLTRPPG